MRPTAIRKQPYPIIRPPNCQLSDSSQQKTKGKVDLGDDEDFLPPEHFSTGFSLSRLG